LLIFTVANDTSFFIWSCKKEKNDSVTKEEKAILVEKKASNYNITLSREKLNEKVLKLNVLHRGCRLLNKRQSKR